MPDAAPFTPPAPPTPQARRDSAASLIRTWAGMPGLWCSLRFIVSGSGRLQFRTSQPRLLLPLIGSRSLTDRPLWSIRNLMASTGSDGLSAGASPRRLEGLYQRGQHVQTIARWRARTRVGLHQGRNLFESGFVVCLCKDRPRVPVIGLDKLPPLDYQAALKLTLIPSIQAVVKVLPLVLSSIFKRLIRSPSRLLIQIWIVNKQRPALYVGLCKRCQWPAMRGPSFNSEWAARER